MLELIDTAAAQSWITARSQRLARDAMSAAASGSADGASAAEQKPHAKHVKQQNKLVCSWCETPHAKQFLLLHSIEDDGDGH